MEGQQQLIQFKSITQFHVTDVLFVFKNEKNEKKSIFRQARKQILRGTS